MGQPTSEEKDAVTKNELMSIGASIITDVDRLIKTSSPKVQTNFRYGVVAPANGTGAKISPSFQIVLLFSMTELGGADEAKLRTSIEGYLLERFKKPEMINRRAQWAIEFPQKTAVNGGGKNGKK